MPIVIEKSKWMDAQIENEERERQKQQGIIKDQCEYSTETCKSEPIDGSLVEHSLLELEKEFDDLTCHLDTLIEKVKPFINPNKPIEENINEVCEKTSQFREKILGIKSKIIFTKRQINNVLNTIEL